MLGAEIDHGWLLWKSLELKMKEELALAGLPGMVKRVAQLLQIEGEEGELHRARDEGRKAIAVPAVATAPAATMQLTKEGSPPPAPPQTAFAATAAPALAPPALWTQHAPRPAAAAASAVSTTAEPKDEDDAYSDYSDEYSYSQSGSFLSHSQR